MGVESCLVLWVSTDECCLPNRFRVELMLIESFEIRRLDFPNRDTLKSTHCFLSEAQAQRPDKAADDVRFVSERIGWPRFAAPSGSINPTLPAMRSKPAGSGRSGFRRSIK